MKRSERALIAWQIAVREDRQLSPNAKMAGWCVATYWAADEPTPTLKRLALGMGRDERGSRTALRGLQELESAGLIWAPRGHRRGKTTIYEPRLPRSLLEAAA